MAALFSPCYCKAVFLRCCELLKIKVTETSRASVSFVEYLAMGKQCTYILAFETIVFLVEYVSYKPSIIKYMYSYMQTTHMCKYGLWLSKMRLHHKMPSHIIPLFRESIEPFQIYSSIPHYICYFFSYTLPVLKWSLSAVIKKFE